MNERIKQLAEQAGMYYRSYPLDFAYSSFDEEKFAKLIVRECARIIESQDVDPAFKHRMGWTVKKHFGVEE